MHGPSAFAQSFPGAGPIPIFPAVTWMSLAEKSLKIVTPNRWPGALVMSISRPPFPGAESVFGFLVIFRRGIRPWGFPLDGSEGLGGELASGAAGFGGFGVLLARS